MKAFFEGIQSLFVDFLFSSHKIMINNNDCYSCGVSGIDNVPNLSTDLLFKTYVYTNMEDQDSDSSLCVCE